MTTLPYSQLQPKIQPLDLILFQGADFVSQTLLRKELKTPNNFSHVGLVVTSDILPDVKALIPGRLYVWESTIANSLPGLQIRDLEEVITAYTATPGVKVAWGHLQKNPWRLTASKQALIETMKGHYDKYTQKIRDAQPTTCCWCRPKNLLSPLDIQGHTLLTSHKQTNWLHHPELSALIYHGFGILPVEKDPQDFTPVDFIAGKSPVIDSILYIKPDMPISMSGQFTTKTQKKAPK